MNKHLETLRNQFNSFVSLKERRPGVHQVIAPLFHEDGDMVDIYIQEVEGGKVRIFDYGMTLMRLSYTFDLDTDNKNRIFNKIIQENGVGLDDGNLYYESEESRLCPSVLHFAQTIAKISNLDFLKREMISGLFFEMVNEFVKESLLAYHPKPGFCPLPGRDDLEVDFAFDIHPHPVYLFAVRGSSKARLASISFLEFQRANLPFKGYVVHDDFNALSGKDRSIITSAADKQFVSFDDFKKHSVQFLNREVAQQV